MPARAIIVAALLSSALALVPAAPDAHAAGLTVTASPPLYPAFNPADGDYVSRCSPSIPLRLSVSAGHGRGVSVDGGAPRRGTFAVRARLRDGQAVALQTESGSYRVRCLSPKFPDWTAVRTGATQAEWYMLTPSSVGLPNGRLSRYVAIVDHNGVPVWWARPKIRPIDVSLLSDGDVAWGRFFGGAIGLDPTGAYEEHRLDGSLVRRVATVGSATDIHDMQRLPNGHYLLLSYVPRDGVDLSAYGGPQSATVLDNEIQEITPDGKKVWTWRSKDHVALSETGRFWPRVLAMPVKLDDGREAYDILHLNSVDPHGSHLVISLRHADAVYDIAKADGAVRWKLGGTQRPESLAVQGADEATLFGGQHDARLLADSTLTVHDNGTGRGRPPRALRLKIDTAARSATLLEQLPFAGQGLSAFGGSARRLAGGDWVVSWGGLPVVQELTPAGVPVFQLNMSPDWFSYRAFPIPYGTLSRARLRADMDAMHPRR